MAPEIGLWGCDGEVLAGCFKGFAEQEIARGVLGDSQRKAVPAIAELELALKIGAPEVVWRGAGRERRAGRPVPRSTGSAGTASLRGAKGKK
jgi:hypothetical protein